jgi:ubiquinone/menaquinone biosynthesis C-methylase UbiE
VTTGSQKNAQEQFGRTAGRYTTSSTHSGNDSLVDLREFVGQQLRSYRTAVDIGTGPGFTAFAIAPFCDRVIATDVTPQMLEEVRHLRHARHANLTQMALAAAEALPFADGSIDLVTCRTAAHHFVDLRRWLREVTRVLAPEGLLVVGDTCSPEDPTIAEWMHQIEIKRDNSHVKNLSPSQWRAVVELAGLEVTDIAMSYVHLHYPDWAERAGMSSVSMASLRQDMLTAPNNVREAFEISERDGGVINFHWDVVVIRAVKRAKG